MTDREKLTELIKSDMIAIFEGGYTALEIAENINSLSDAEVTEILADYESEE